MPKKHERDTVSRQISLPWGISFSIAWKSLRVRFLRSLVTTGSLTLAVAFLAFVLVGVDMAQGYLSSGAPKAAKELVRAGFNVNAEIMTVGTGPKERWIVILSLIVCAAGIINAQMMSVTERFREIGVMKCLGALDSMVLRLFLIEASIQGLAGATAGALLGTLGAILNGAVRFGAEAVLSASATSILASFWMAAGAGIILSLIGVFYPAMAAARMKPIMALRAEH